MAEPGVRFTRDSARRISDVVRIVEGEPFETIGFRRQRHFGAATRASLLAFGCKILTQGTVRVFPGVIEHGTQVFESTQTDVNMNEGDNFVYVEYIWTSSVSIEVASIRPLTTDFSFKKALCKFSHDTANNKTTLSKIEWQGGNIHIPGAFAG